ncbi:late endosome to vacuole transport-related protein [Pseudohyphozyma bogoriensis]|nr:late endosome to vacuole transport-related protein [Pseudohyphozyma bogoriensis]
MAAPVPSDYKPVAPFLARAHELAKPEPAISYWCTYYAAQQAMTLGSKQPESTAFLVDLIDKLEKLKEELGTNETVTDETTAAAYVEGFALKVFNQADKEDRANKITRGTAKKFLAAANFLELLSIFGDIEPSNKEKIKYSKWKAADIAKAFREGRTPVPGPAGGLPVEDDLASPTAAPQPGVGVEEADSLLPTGDASKMSEEEAKELAKELEQMSANDVVPSAPPHAASEDESVEPASYPFPQQPSTIPPSVPTIPPSPLNPLAPAPAPPSPADSLPQTPAFPSFLNTPGANTPPTSGLPHSPALHPIPTAPQTHQTSILPPPPPSTTGTTAFPAAVFPPSLQLPTSSASPPAPVRSPAPPSSAPSAPAIPQPPQVQTPLPTSPAVIYSTPSPSIPQSSVGGGVQTFMDPTLVSTIQKHAKWAISALNYEDVETARKELKKALELLG